MRRIDKPLLIAACTFSALLIVWFFKGHSLMYAIFEGVKGMKLGMMIEHHKQLDPGVRSPDYYVSIAWWGVIRLIIIGLIISVIGYFSNHAIAKLVRKLWNEHSSPQHVALLRITTFITLPIYTILLQSYRFSALPDALIIPPFGWSWFPDAWMPSSLLTGILTGFLVTVSLLAAAGIKYRLMSWSTVALGIIVLGIPQFYGKINHYHHLVLIGAVLASAPAADAWVLNKKINVFHSGVAYGRTVRAVWIIIGLCYFFPGFWKVVIGGGEWIFGRTFEYTLYSQWLHIGQPGPELPSMIYSILGTSIVLWELTFLPLLFFTRIRPLIAISGLIFHIVTYLVAGINFWTLAIFYVSFLPDPWIDRKVEYINESRSQRRTTALIIILMIITGMFHIDSWPVAVYPTFAAPQGHVSSSIRIVGWTGPQPKGDPDYVLNPTLNENIRRSIGLSRIMGFIKQVMLAPTEDDKKIRATALVSVLTNFDLQFDNVLWIAVDEVQIELLPNIQGKVLSRNRVIGPLHICP